MSSRFYALPIDQTRWEVPSGADVHFDWSYDEGRDRLLRLYERGKAKQWDAQTRIDWSLPYDPASAEQEADEHSPIYGSAVFERMTAKEKEDLRVHMGSWVNSQFLHGEQGALICAAKVVATVPDLDSKFYAATQVVDEARHVELYSKYLREHFGFAYPIDPSLRDLLNTVIADSRWDMTYLGMQVIIEGLALAAFAMARDLSPHPLTRAINAYVMQDEARHVAFGRLALRDYYPQLTSAERDEREEFVVTACHLMRDRFLAGVVYEQVGLPADECVEFVKDAPMTREFRRLLFSRIVPTVKDIGLWGPKVRRAFEEMGVVEFAALDPDDLLANDEQVAEGLDAARRVQVDQTIAAGRT
jgi:P-aminobenzoate N-oxygenase AurF